MAATLTVIVVDAEGGMLLQIGDSRAYRLRDGALAQLSHDQTVAQQLLDDGRIDAAAFAEHPDRGTLLQCLGLEGIGRPLEPVVTEFDLRAGDRLLLCSDGLSDLVADDAIAARLAAREGREAACAALVDAALEAGGHDNVTVVVVEV